MTTLDIYWSFRSPYSHLAIFRLIDIAQNYLLEINLRFVRPLAVRNTKQRDQRPPQQVPYIILDIQRQGEFLGIPIALPKPDPVTKHPETSEISKDQSRLMNIIGLGLAANSYGKGLAFAAEISKLVWGVENWHKGDFIERAAENAGLEFNKLKEWVVENSESITQIIEENETKQSKHHWGVPLMVIDDAEPFFGQDRIDVLEYKLDLMGLKRA